MCSRGRTSRLVLLLLAAAACGRPEGEPLALEAYFVDDEFSAGEFGAGACQGSAWIPELGLALAPGQKEGSFLSRILDAGSTVGWKYIAWVPLGHYGQALPDHGGAETRGAGAVTMAGNVLLLHLDGSGPVAGGGRLADSSGMGNDAIVATAAGGSVGFAGGPFRQALAGARGSYAYVPLAARSDFDFGSSDFTWSLWVKTTQDCAGNKVYLGAEDGVAGRPHLWLGCYSSGGAYPLCAGCASGGCAGGLFTATRGGAEEEAARFCGKRAINDDAWHHMAVVKRGHDDAVVSLYVDGDLAHETTAHFAAPIVFSNGPQLAIGAFSKGAYRAEASLDEVAIWRRALAADEVRSLYLRGALLLGFQVRTCRDSKCVSAPPFVGPGNSPDALFVDEEGGDHAPVRVSLAGIPASRYLQYRAVFASGASQETPVLSSVNVVPSP